MDNGLNEKKMAICTESNSVRMNGEISYFIAGAQ